MRISQLLRGSRRAVQLTRQSTRESSSFSTSHFIKHKSLRNVLFVGSISLSLLAIVHGEMTCPADGTAACEMKPEANLIRPFPLDAEEFHQIQIPKARTKKYSCASYKANFPIEDKFQVESNEDGDVYALVLDGHGGWQVSEYGKKTLISNVQHEVKSLEIPMSSTDMIQAIQRGFQRTDRDLMGKVAEAFKLGFGSVARCGSCALLAFVHDSKLYVANAGDIRAVMGQKAEGSMEFTPKPLSNDQNAMSIAEQEKLVRDHPNEQNVFICRHPSSCYVKGALQPTRALGDFALKFSEFNGPPYQNGDRSAGRHVRAPYTPPYITATPEVLTHDISDTGTDQFLIIGSDGLWDYLSNKEAVEVVAEQLKNGTPEQAGRALVERVLEHAADSYQLSFDNLLDIPPGGGRRRLHDDTTVVVLFFE